MLRKAADDNILHELGKMWKVGDGSVGDGLIWIKRRFLEQWYIVRELP